jgi:hypothetical protein
MSYEGDLTLLFAVVFSMVVYDLRLVMICESKNDDQWKVTEACFDGTYMFCRQARPDIRHPTGPFKVKALLVSYIPANSRFLQTFTSIYIWAYVLIFTE